MGFMWLGGIATYTTVGHRCTQMVMFQCDCGWMFTWYFEYFGVCFLVIYVLSLDAWLYDVSFTLCIPFDVVSIWLDDDVIADWSNYAIVSLACQIL